VFASGAAASAGSAGVALTPAKHAAAARRLAVGGAVAELVTKQTMEKRLGELGEPYKAGAPKTLGRIAQVGMAGGAALIGAAGARSRAAAIAGAALIGAGALAARWSVFKAGFASAADPKYTVAPQRERIERRGSPGASRDKSKVTDVRPELATPATSDGG
jgi:hypothetical protein